MLGIELQQTRVYQDAKAEGRTEGESIGLERGKIEGERALVLKQLTLRLVKVSDNLQERVNDLPVEKIELLGEALLDFTSVADLEKFLDS